MKPVHIQSVSILGPGMPDWHQSVALLDGSEVCELLPLQMTAPTSLPANERRRASRLSKMALRVAEQAMAGSDLDTMDQATVFASSCGDLDIVDKICTALTLDDKPVSPTQFHNSVHNAQAGYWAIANQVYQASSSISAYTGSFSAGLLEAVTIVNVEQIPVLLVVYDRPAPGVLYSSAPSRFEFATALLLVPEQRMGAMACMQLALQEPVPREEVHTLCHSTVLEELRLGCPAARSLPLLESLARKQAGSIVLPYLSGLDLLVSLDVYDQ